MNRTIILIGVGLLAVVLIALAAVVGINRASSPPDTAATLNPFYTSQAQTLQAALTPVTPTSTPFLLTPPTPEPGQPSITPAPTFTFPPPLATGTPAAQIPCDRVQFVSDVTVPDGSLYPANTSFTKTWRLKNTGTCTWTTGYALAFAGGARMDGPTNKPLTTTVAPGQTIELSVNLVSPASSGTYTGYWMLRNPAGQTFGAGDTGSSPFWVKIVVEAGTTVIYNFAESACSATWKSGAGTLPCPGTNGDTDGFVLIQNHPMREDGATENEKGILTVPEDVRNGYIRGKYPTMTIKNGDRFKAIIDCQYNFRSCNVVFKLNYQIEGQDTKTLWEFNEAYEGEYYSADIDLSSLAGKQVRFILVVEANGSPNQDHAQWIAPRIVRLSSLVPAPTNTPRPTRTPTAAPTNTPTPTATPTT
jgi:Ig-like domain-containing protein